ncbi:MAG: NAD(P)/FAD-dependent oxidoreductase [Anaerolineales bacterium]
MKHFNFIVIGGGPAGLMAAGQAASQGVQTLLIEKMDRPGRKLEITGKGRCNLTNIETLDAFIGHFNREGKFLFSAFSRFFSQDLIEFFERLGVDTVVERGGRVFPQSSDAQQVVVALVEWIHAQGVTTIYRSTATDLILTDQSVRGVQTKRTHNRAAHRSDRSSERMSFSCDTLLIATGGVSYPGTGSTGDGYELARRAGHSVVPIRPALIPVDTAGDLAQRLQGLTLKNVAVTVYVGNQPIASAFGEMLFTHFGLSGPIILTLSRTIVDALSSDQSVEVSIDLKPALDEQKLDARLLRDLDQNGSQQFKNLLKGLLPRKMIPVCIDQVDIPARRASNQITAVERERLKTWLKDFRLTIIGHRPIAQAIVTAGGIATDEIDPRTMQSRLIDGLYFAGEVLDLDADTGGYNLQASFSTGWLAGRAVAEKIGSHE